MRIVGDTPSADDPERNVICLCVNSIFACFVLATYYNTYVQSLVPGSRNGLFKKYIAGGCQSGLVEARNSGAVATYQHVGGLLRRDTGTERSLMR